ITATTVDGNKKATCEVTVEDNNSDITLLTNKGVVIEDFTATWCGPCYFGMSNIKKVLKNFDHDRVMLVCHHLNDDFEVIESRTLATAYKVSGIPSCMVNRTNVYGYSINFNPSYLTTNIITKQLEAETSVHIGMRTSYNETTKELKVEVAGNLLSALPQARLNVYLVQDSIIAYQNNGGSNYAHRNALRKILSADAVWGDPLGVSTGKFSKTYTYTIPDKIGKFATDLKKMYVVAFVAEHHSTTEMRNNIIHNTVIKKVK
ncbi:MAG: Omp28-related outer membrane protein, partial [Porphyromonadaceae bacterium]|nr:Omp28-related outer membrane protein [Porphyromonadaceae bacterium]